MSCRAVARKLRELHPDIVTPSQETVHTWCRRAGILRNKTQADEIAQHNRNGIDYDRIREEAPVLASERNWSVHAIARHFGVSRNVINRVVARDTRSDATRRRHNLADHPDTNKRREDQVYAATRRAEGAAIRDIAAELGRPEPTVRRWLRGCSEWDGT